VVERAPEVVQLRRKRLFASIYTPQYDERILGLFILTLPPLDARLIWPEERATV
jgi:hypothetical protein